MRYTLIIAFLFCLLPASTWAQQPEMKPIRVADTLTTQEKRTRNPIILRAELDSMVKLHNASHPPVIPVQTVREVVKETTPSWLWIVIVASLAGIGFLLFLLFTKQKLVASRMEETKRLIQQAESTAAARSVVDDPRSVKGLEKKIQALNAELDKMKNDNVELQQLLGEYQNVKQQINASYKIRNYPGYDKSKTEEELLQGLLSTERSVAVYSYEHFLKPIIAIADANKNNPARINKEDREKLMELLVSLSLLYIEYLYLRVNELSVGGNMVARIQSLSNGNGLDTILMKQLNTEHGSRALVLRMILDKMNIRHLTYPVFDETNLNLS